MELTALYLSFPVAAVAVALGWRPWRGETAPRTGPPASALGVVLCLVAGWYGHHDAWPSLLPGEVEPAKAWLLPALVAAGLGCLAPRRLAWQVLTAWAAAELVVGAGLDRVLDRIETHRDWLELGLKAAVAVYAVNLAALVRREGFEVPALALLSLVAAATVQRGGWGSGALLLAAVGFTVCGTVVVGLWRRGWSPLAGAGTAVGAVAAGVLLLGERTAESPLAATLVAAAVPLLGWLPVPGRWGILLRLLLAAGAVAGAHLLSVPPPDPYADYYG